MKIHFLGTCSGTEPYPGRHHSSFVIEYDQRLYWFDAGEGCGHTAHVMGLDTLSTEAMFISHPHIDHTGGLPHLVWMLKKLESRTEEPISNQIDVFLPHMKIWQGVESLLFLARTYYGSGITYAPQRIEEGQIYNKNGLSVTTVHNNHIGERDEVGKWMSFSFRIATDTKSIVFSGDFRDMTELEELLSPDGTDLLLVETGHHRVEDICSYVVNSDKPIKRVGFIHHGVAILKDYDGELSKAKTFLGDRVFFANDAMTITL